MDVCANQKFLTRALQQIEGPVDPIGFVCRTGGDARIGPGNAASIDSEDHAGMRLLRPRLPSARSVALVMPTLPCGPAWNSLVFVSAYTVLVHWVHCTHRLWLSTLLHRRPPLGPNYLRHFEYCLQSVAGLGLDIRSMTRLVGTLYVFVLGFVAYELQELENDRRLGMSDAERRAAVEPYLTEILETGSFPAVQPLSRARRGRAGGRRLLLRRRLPPRGHGGAVTDPLSDRFPLRLEPPPSGHR